MNVDVGEIVIASAAHTDLRIRANGERPGWHFAVDRPFTDGLLHEGERRHEKQDATALAGQCLCYLQCGEGLARTAGHDELATTRAGKTIAHGGQCVALVLTRLLLRKEPDCASVGKGTPIDSAVFQIGQADPKRVHLLVVERRFGVGRSS